LNILLVSAEVSPFAKVGGLADVAGALPKDLVKLGHDVRVAMPCYPMVENDARYNVRPVIDDVEVKWGDGSTKHAFVKSTQLDSVPVYLIGGEGYFSEATESKKVYSAAGWEPYAFFVRSILEMVKVMEPRWIPDVIHVNDWHTGFLPVYLKVSYANDTDLNHIATIMTVHNLAYQGEFDFAILREAGLPDELYSLDKLECYGRVNFMKAGLVYADMINTVSETYACEIQTEEYGCRLDGLLRYAAFNDRLRGILNGIDYAIFDPATDKRIKHNFSADDTAGKAKCKADLQKELGLPVKKSVPVIGMVTRLADQKGLDILKKAMPSLMKDDLQLVILGTGDPSYEKYFADQAKKHPDKVSANIGFDAALAQRIYAGSDFFLMPSRFEPCGLGQMISLRYGSVPIVRRTGGLGDTITEFDSAAGSGNGFVFEKYDVKELTAAIERALIVFAKPALRKQIISNGMNCDFSTTRCAEQYSALYSEAIRRKSHSAAA